MEWYVYVIAGLGAVAAGFINALAGGGTLVSFPILTAIGLPAVSANITNTVALVPGYLGATYAQLKDLSGQRLRLLMYIPAAVVGGVIGGILLVNTGEKVFRSLIPFLILGASLLLAVSDPMRKWVMKRVGEQRSLRLETALGILPIVLAAIYGGYFGAGLSVIVLAVLGLVVSDSLTRLNALKQAIAFSVNVSAAVFFLFSNQVNWPIAAIMAVCALLGGMLGGKLARRIKPAMLRWVVVTIGVVVSIIYFVR